MRLNHPESDAQVWRSPKHTEDLSVLPAFTGTHWQAFFLILKSWLLMPFNYQITSAETNQLRNLVIWVRCRWTVVCSAQQMSEKETATTASSPVSYYSTGWFLRWSCHFWHFFKCEATWRKAIQVSLMLCSLTDCGKTTRASQSVLGWIVNVNGTLRNSETDPSTFQFSKPFLNTGTFFAPFYMLCHLK